VCLVVTVTGWRLSDGASHEVYSAHHDEWGNLDYGHLWPEVHEAHTAHVDEAEREWLLRQQQEQHHVQLKPPHQAATQATQQQNVQGAHSHHLDQQAHMQQAAQHHQVHNDLSLKLGMGAVMAQRSSWH